MDISARMQHVGITVSNMERSLWFYCTVLGMKTEIRVERGEEWIQRIVGMDGVRLEIAHLSGLGTGIELLQYTPQGCVTPRDTDRPGNIHICVAVFDAEAWSSRLKEAGVRLMSEPVTIPDGPQKGAKCFYARDPDGNTVEFFQWPRR